MILPRTQSGFSLVETLVAITILLIIIVGPMTIISSASNSTSFASEQVIAFFLAQEGAELAQKARDDLVLKGFLPNTHSDYEATPWEDFSATGGTFANCFTPNVGCGLEINDDATGSVSTPITCSGTNCRLYYDSSGTRSRYTHTNTGSQSGFTRKIYFSYISDHEVAVVSTVEWLSGSSRRVQSVEVETFLFNVYGN